MDEKRMTPLQAIRAKCLDCTYGDKKEVTLCPCKECPLYQYRSGKTGRKRNLTDEQRAVLAERMRKVKSS